MNCWRECLFAFLAGMVVCFAAIVLFVWLVPAP
jgi:hypothetical protein